MSADIEVAHPIKFARDEKFGRVKAEADAIRYCGMLFPDKVLTGWAEVRYEYPWWTFVPQLKSPSPDWQA